MMLWRFQIGPCSASWFTWKKRGGGKETYGNAGWFWHIGYLTLGLNKAWRLKFQYN